MRQLVFVVWQSSTSTYGRMADSISTYSSTAVRYAASSNPKSLVLFGIVYANTVRLWPWRLKSLTFSLEKKLQCQYGLEHEPTEKWYRQQKTGAGSCFGFRTGWLPHPENGKEEQEGFSPHLAWYGKRFLSIGRPTSVVANCLSWGWRKTAWFHSQIFLWRASALQTSTLGSLPNRRVSS